jgi:hypothetical protein
VGGGEEGEAGVARVGGWMGGGKAAEAMAANWVEKVVRMLVQML